MGYSLNTIKPYRFLEKAISYKKIIELSEKLIYEKHLLLKDYKGYDPELLRQKFNITLDELLPTRTMIKYKLFKTFDEFLWRKGLKKNELQVRKLPSNP